MNIQNVVVVNDHAFVNGGQAKVAIDSAKNLARSGVNVIFFAACGPVDETMETAGVQTICLNQNDILAEPNRIKAMARGIWNAKSAKTLKVLLDGLDPKVSIVHCHGFAKALSPSIGPVITDGPIPHIYTIHEYFLACPNGAFYDFQRDEICTRKALGASCLVTDCDARRRLHKFWRVARQATLWNFGKMPKNLGDIVYMSEIQLDVMSPYIDAKTRLHKVINPVDFSGGKRVMAENNDIALFVGRLGPEKGCTLFAKAAKEAEMTAVFVGEGPERDAIMQANPNAIITGWLATNEVEAWLEKSRCLVFPTLLYETFGLVAYEALAKGIPVICGDWTAAREAIVHEETGFIAHSREVANWSQILGKVKNDVHQMSVNAHASSMKLFKTTKPHHERLIEVYDSVLEQFT